MDQEIKKQRKEKRRKVIRWMLPSFTLAVGVLMCLLYITPINFCICIGICMCIVGVLSSFRSVVSEIKVKRYIGPDVFSGIAIISFGIVFMETGSASFLLASFPILSIILGLWLIADSLLSLFVRKKQAWIEFGIGAAYFTLGIILVATISFGTYNALFLGITVCLYAVYLFHKTRCTPEKIEVEKIQEEYEMK